MDITLEEFEIFAIARLKGKPMFRSIHPPPTQITSPTEPSNLDLNLTRSPHTNPLASRPFTPSLAVPRTPRLDHQAEPPPE